MKTVSVRLTDVEFELLTQLVMFHHYPSASALFRELLVTQGGRSKLKAEARKRIESERAKHKGRKRKGAVRVHEAKY